ncbi:uncharacterized protein LOC111458393 [Cucurbita moschata]|uniref:Uncharacterized protein LOC111458393 n=1 Tax=Cucurbita moschata TaxID=3662 RepID=A0A6J1H041_CUCMO|nr:uncharacterized protein LOC111458393 [Cucurbita moschata]
MGKKKKLALPSTNDSEACWEHPLESRANTSIGDEAGSSPQCSKDLSSKSRKQIDDSERSSTSPKLRRTWSLSSAAFRDQGQINFYSSSDPSRSPGNASSGSRRQHEQSSCPSREMKFKVKHAQMEMPNDYHSSGPVRPCSRTCYDSSGNSSTSSSTVSNGVLARYIDGEQHRGINGSMNKYSQRSNGWRPPRAQCLPPSSTTARIADKPRFYSSREAKCSLPRFLSEEVGEYGFGNDSPRSIAETVVNRLSQHHAVPKATSKELGENIPIKVTDNGSESGDITIKLDSEMSTRVYHLQNQGLVLLNESTQFCSNLLEFIKEKVGRFHPTEHRIEHIKNCLDGQFFLESETKIRGFKHRIESLTMSLQKLSILLQAKSDPSSLSSGVDNALQLNSQYPEDGLRSELEAETLFSRLLREKLYSKELEVEQLQAELVTAVRGNDILKCEIQNVMDSLSCLTHTMKDLELQDYLSKLQALEENILLKEGQITILKDTLGSKSIEFLAPPSSMWEFRLQ